MREIEEADRDRFLLECFCHYCRLELFNLKPKSNYGHILETLNQAKPYDSDSDFEEEIQLVRLDDTK